MSPQLLPIVLLSISNVFMTFAWYGHLRTLRGAPLRHFTRCQTWVRQNGPMEPRTSSFWPPSTGVRRRL